MRLSKIDISWFRGASDTISLETNARSCVIYGENGAGKSSFVDAVEYAIHKGRILHLAHEKSGARQEKAIPNTHTPSNVTSGFKLHFDDGSTLETKISKTGSSTISGNKAIESWEYSTTILRQDEVAQFIKDTKGGKYSTLLPLLGLDKLEIAAENLRQLARAIEREGTLTQIKAHLDSLLIERNIEFGENSTNDDIIAKIKALYEKYVAGITQEPIAQCSEILTKITELLASLSLNQEIYQAQLAIKNSDITAEATAIRAANSKIALSTQLLVEEKLRVLEASALFASKLSENVEIECPACGQKIKSEAFISHIQSERDRLDALVKLFHERQSTIDTLCTKIENVLRQLKRPALSNWVDGLQGDQAAAISYLKQLPIDQLRRQCDEGALIQLENHFPHIVAAATSATNAAPEEALGLNADSRITKTALAILRSVAQSHFLAEANAIKQSIETLEIEIRERIKAQSNEIVSAISTDIQAMWKILHPNKEIEDVRLHSPDDTSKSIDICLKFYGVEQDSPRLTLSEGFRNSLGLCIFLAMAKRVQSDKPVILDDVVVSIDRNHRGMIVELLESLFSNRQIILFTHDRDWYVELRQRLNASQWQFKALMPYDKPTLGIRWSAKNFGFDDARAVLNDASDTACNIVRKIMDSSLAAIAEKLGVPMPYLHRERNDHRTAHDFLSKLISHGEKCWQVKNGASHEKFDAAITKLKEADKLLLTWANKGSHTFDVPKPEAQKLIDICEAAVEAFTCDVCGKPVHKLEDKQSELVRCDCGKMRWRYGNS